MLFRSELLAGFECSTHRRFDNRRLDVICATGHDKFADADYRRLKGLGFGTAREGLRWHLIESTPGKFDFSSVESQLAAAERYGIDVIWDLFHYGYPDWLDIFSGAFVERFANFAYHFAQFFASRSLQRLFVVPVNEISFFAWAAGDEGFFHPFERNRGDELKRQMARSAIAAVQAVRTCVPDATIISAEPAIHVAASYDDPAQAAEAESYRLSQYQAADMLTGRLAPELGGRPEYLDVVGVNYYPHNQWYYPDRTMMALDDPNRRPLSEMLIEVSERYGKPVLIAETGTEDEMRCEWAERVIGEYKLAHALGANVAGICFYPIVNHPGWVDDRHCPNGVWGYADEKGERPVHQPLADILESFAAERAARTNSRRYAAAR